MSTLRFIIRPSPRAFDAMGWYSAYPAALSRLGLNRTIKSRMTSIARAVESSQFEETARCGWERYRCDLRCASG
jgi:hypothetical protein